jgi:hypothetical protein
MEEEFSDYITVNELTEKLKEQVSDVQEKKREYNHESAGLTRDNL